MDEQFALAHDRRDTRLTPCQLADTPRERLPSRTGTLTDQLFDGRLFLSHRLTSAQRLRLLPPLLLSIGRFYLVSIWSLLRLVAIRHVLNPWSHTHYAHACPTYPQDACGSSVRPPYSSRYINSPSARLASQPVTSVRQLGEWGMSTSSQAG